MKTRIWINTYFVCLRVHTVSVFYKLCEYKREIQFKTIRWNVTDTAYAMQFFLAKFVKVRGKSGDEEEDA